VVIGVATEMLTGIVPAALTMFDAKGRLDLPASRAHFEALLADGADGLVVAGTSGEFIALTDRERLRLIEVAVDLVAGRVPVIAGTGAYSTAATVSLTRAAERAGADAALVILPYYQRPARAEVLEHYRAVARRSRLPLLAYNNPANSAAPELLPADLATLHREGIVHGVKSTFPTVHQVHELAARTDPSFRIFYGSFMAPLEGLAGGAHGWISGILNVAARDARDLFQAVQRSDLAAAREAWARILPIKLLYTDGLLGQVSDLAIYRALLKLRGGHGGHSRRPLRDLDGDAMKRLAQHLARAETASRVQKDDPTT
jgi:4-hydroxy-tetrahydrodipicolinate synthase